MKSARSKATGQNFLVSVCFQYLVERTLGSFIVHEGMDFFQIFFFSIFLFFLRPSSVS